MEEWILKENPQQNWISFILIFNFMLLTLLKIGHKTQFQYFTSFLNMSMYFKIYGHSNLRFQSFTLLGLLFLLLNLSLSLFFIFNTYSVGEYSFSFFINLSILIFCFVILRFIFSKISFALLGISSFTNFFQFKSLIYQIQISILAFILLVLYKYSFPYLDFLYGILIISYFLYFLSQLLLFKEHWSILKHNLLYLILYLCTLKLTPWIILYSII